MAMDKEPQIQTQELVLRGVFSDRSYDRVLSLIRVMCPQSGYLMEIREWERGFKKQDDQMSVLRFRQNLSQRAEANIRVRTDKTKFLLRHIGRPDTRIPKPCQKLPTLEVRVASNPLPLIQALGFVQQYQYIRIGHRFVTSEGYTVEIYRIETVVNNDIRQTTRLPGGIVEVIAQVSTTKQPQPEELLTFMSYLSPAVVVPGAS